MDLCDFLFFEIKCAQVDSRQGWHHLRFKAHLDLCFVSLDWSFDIHILENGNFLDIMQLYDDQQVSRIQGKGEDEITNWHIAHSRFHSMSRQRIHWIITAQSQLPKFSPTCSFHVGTNYKTRAPPEFHWSGQPLWEFAAFIVEIVWQLDFLCQSLPAVNEYLEWA